MPLTNSFTVKVVAGDASVTGSIGTLKVAEQALLVATPIARSRGTQEKGAASAMPAGSFAPTLMVAT